GDWGEHSDFQRGERGAAEWAAVSSAGTAGDAGSDGQQHDTTEERGVHGDGRLEGAVAHAGLGCDGSQLGPDTEAGGEAGDSAGNVGVARIFHNAGCAADAWAGLPTRGRQTWAQ